MIRVYINMRDPEKNSVSLEFLTFFLLWAWFRYISLFPFCTLQTCYQKIFHDHFMVIMCMLAFCYLSLKGFSIYYGNCVILCSDFSFENSSSL
jgi:hypothetical protein